MCVPGLELLAVISTIHLLERENNIHVDLRKQNKRQEDSKTIIVLVCLVCLFVLDVCLYWLPAPSCEGGQCALSMLL